MNAHGLSSMRKTQQVSTDEPEDAQDTTGLDDSNDDVDGDAADIGSDSSTSDGDDSVRDDDLAWPIPPITMVPLAGVLLALVTWAFGLDWVLVSIIPFVVLAAAVTVIDLRELRIPDKLTRPASLVAIPLLLLSLLSDLPELSIWRALLGALAMGGFYFVLLFIYPPGMGWGDVKFAPIIGAQLGLFGWIPLVRGVVAAYLIVGPVAILLMIFGRARLKSGLPFGPFMAAGAIVALVLEARGY